MKKKQDLTGIATLTNNPNAMFNIRRENELKQSQKEDWKEITFNGCRILYGPMKMKDGKTY